MHSMRSTILVSTRDECGLIISLPFLRDELTYAAISGSLGFYTMVAVFVITVKMQRDELEKDRQTELIGEPQSIKEETVLKAETRGPIADCQQDRQCDFEPAEFGQYSAINSKRAKATFNLRVLYCSLYDDEKDPFLFPILYDGDRF